MHPYSRASMASAFSNRPLSLNGALGLSKSSVENFLKHAQAILVRWLISRVRSASLVMRPSRYTNWWTWLYFWPAAAISSAGRGGVGVSPGCCAFSGARIRRVSVFFSDTIKPNAPNTSTMRSDFSFKQSQLPAVNTMKIIVDLLFCPFQLIGYSALPLPSCTPSLSLPQRELCGSLLLTPTVCYITINNYSAICTIKYNTLYRRYFQHAHFIPIVSVGKRGAY